MASGAGGEVVSLADLSEMYRVVFTADSNTANFNPCHEESVKAVDELGSQKFSCYANSLDVVESEAWKLEAKKSAEVLVQKAVRCQDRNESSWRFACENFIFARLSGEVAW